jgi:PhzF family phenazine biosynthesis protein
VFLLSEPRDDVWMQQIAREMNLSETAFLTRQADGFALRWFTPAVEIDLCGHATLASAHMLWEDGHLPHAEPARFHTRSGLLTAHRNETWIELDFPANPATATDAPPDLERALGVTLVSTHRNQFDYLVEVEHEAAVRSLQPDIGLLATLPVQGVIVTSHCATPEYDFVSRYFAPAAGIDEDPVTGAAHCCLTPFWSERLGKSEMVAYQASVRGGVVRVRLQGNRVALGGQAVTMLRGEVVC